MPTQEDGSYYVSVTLRMLITPIRRVDYMGSEYMHLLEACIYSKTGTKEKLSVVVICKQNKRMGKAEKCRLAIPRVVPMY